jgi:hypothetical protein
MKHGIFKFSEAEDLGTGETEVCFGRQCSRKECGMRNAERGIPRPMSYAI